MTYGAGSTTGALVSDSCGYSATFVPHAPSLNCMVSLTYLSYTKVCMGDCYVSCDLCDMQENKSDPQYESDTVTWLHVGQPDIYLSL